MEDKEDPGKLSAYLRHEKGVLALITITGIIYNIGMVAGPWFEGRMAQTLVDILHASASYSDMVKVVIAYILTIALVQGSRALKRFYVRRFANNMNRRMKQNLYRTILHQDRKELEKESTGSIMTKAVSDVDAMVEGVRKVVTEIFDTGVVMVAYIVMLVRYDALLTVLACMFVPLAYWSASKLRHYVTSTSAAAKESRERLSSAALDRVSSAITYRIYGVEKRQNELYEGHLQDYEHNEARANILAASSQPVYQVIAMAGIVFILYYGAKNVMGTGRVSWDIAAFTTYLACFSKLAAKVSHGAKLFNAEQKARVSWKRIQPLLKKEPEDHAGILIQKCSLEVKDLSFHYPDQPDLFHGVSFEAHAGEIIGITGAVASGKSTFGRMFLGEEPYEGSIRINGKELRDLDPDLMVSGYLGHHPDLFSTTIEENIQNGTEGDVWPCIKAVCLEEEIKALPDGIHTMAAEEGKRFSGGQQARLALARALYHRRAILVLDDPFSAVDMKTEEKIMNNIRDLCTSSIVLLISHRLAMFPGMDHVLYLHDGSADFLSHEEMMKKEEGYRKLVMMQQKGGDLDEQ